MVKGSGTHYMLRSVTCNNNKPPHHFNRHLQMKKMLKELSHLKADDVKMQVN